MEGSHEHHKSDAMSVLMVLAGSGLVLFVIKLLSDQVFDHEDRLVALESAWGRKEVPEPVGEAKEDDNG